MAEKEEQMPDISRRDLLKLSGMAVGAAALGSTLSGCSNAHAAGNSSQKNSLLAGLDPYIPGTETLDDNEMRITFLGTSCIPMISQAAVSVFVELGKTGCFVFDMGTGSMIKYWAMGISMDKLSKIFLAHLHADHMGDLPFVYGFGPSYGRVWPLYIWGPGDSGCTYTEPGGQGRTFGPYADGTKAYCNALKQMMVWHNESQSFLSTSYSGYTPPYYDPHQMTDAYDLVPFELDWRKTGKDSTGKPNGDNVAYNQDGVKITHFPAVHTREGSVSYKLEWTTPSGQVLSMIYAGDTKPNQYMIDQALPGVDVLIHEIVMPADVWVSKMGIDPVANPNAVQQAQNVQDSSHTPQKAYGYILDQIKQNGKAPTLAVGTHFQATDDTINAALKDIRTWYPTGDVTIASDTMVLNVKKNAPVRQRRGVVSNYTWPQTVLAPGRTYNTPKYWKFDPTTGLPTGDPAAQLDPQAKVIDPSLYNAR